MASGKTTKKRSTRKGAQKKGGKGTKPAFDDPKCAKCPASCCRYIALEIDAPDDKESIDHMRWYLAHQNVSIYLQDDDWHLCVDVRCKYLDSNDSCTIHATRPEICREHSPEECEFENPDYELEAEFRSWDALEAYLAQNGLLVGP